MTFPKYVIKDIVSSAMLSWITGSAEGSCLVMRMVSNPVQGTLG